MSLGALLVWPAVDAAAGVRAVKGREGCVAAVRAPRCQLVPALRGVERLAVSPDGAHVYAATSTGVVGFSRRRSTGRLSWLGPRGCVDGRGRFGCVAWSALGGGLHDLTMSADGRRLFAVGNEAVVALEREPGTGAVRPVAGAGGCLTVEPVAGCGLLHDAGEVGDPAPDVGFRVALSPDGATVYTLGLGADDSLLVVRVDPVTGGLSQLPGRAGCAGPNPACGDRRNRFVDLSEMLAVSPDGLSLYAGGVSFAREAVTGRLSAPERIRAETMLPELSQTVVSGDGRFAYVVDGSSFRLFTFARDRGRRLTRLGGRDGCLAMPFWMGARCRRAWALPGCDGDLVLSPGGRRLYVASGCGETGLAVFRRDPKTGVLHQLPGRTGCYLNRRTRRCGRLPIGEAPDVAVAPDGRHLYVASDYPSHIRTLRLTAQRRASKLSAGGPSAPVAYASWPFPTPPFPLGSPPTMLAAPDEDELVVGRRGAVLQLSTRADGSLAIREAVDLPIDAEPIAALVWGDTVLVLDATTSSVLVFEGSGSARRLVAKLPVGPAPSGLAIAGDYVAVANAGSNDVSLLSRGSDNRGPWATAGRVPVGPEPRAIVAGDFTDDYSEDLAVANAGAGTLTVLAHEDRGRFVRSADITIGGAPHALTVTPSTENEADEEVVAGPAAGNSLVVLAKARDRLRKRRTIPLPGAIGPIALALGAAVDEGDRRDLAVADRGAGGVWLLRGDPRGGFRSPTWHPQGEPVAIASQLLGGDFQVDFAVADARAQAVSLLVTPGDRLLSAPGETVGALAARGGRVVWSRRAGRGDYRLVAWRSGTARELPIASSTRPLVPHLGRLARHDPVATYVRCTVRRCATFAWHFRQQRERRLRLPIPGECAVNQVAAWDRHRAFTLTRPWNARCRSTGLWLQSRPRPARRIDASGRFGALASGRLAWLDLDGDSRRVRVMTIGRHTRTVTRGNADCCSEGTPTLSRRSAYYTAVGMDGEQTLPLYANPAPTPPCSRTRHTYAWFDGVPSDDYYSARYAVDGRRIYYADARGVWRTDPGRVRWHCER